MQRWHTIFTQMQDKVSSIHLMHVKCQTGPCRAKPRLASPNVTKRENRACRNLSDTIFFFDCPLSNFLKKHNILTAGSVSVFNQRSTYAGGLPRWNYSLSLGTIQTVNLLRYAPENRPSLRVKPWFLTTTQWHLRKRDAARRSQSCGFEGGWFLRVALMSVLSWHCVDAAASCSCGIRFLTSAWRRRSLVTTGRKSCCLFTAVVFLYTTSCKEEFDETLIDCVRSFPVIYNLSKKLYKDKIAKDNAWKTITTALERDGKFSV